jgi:hypothetical protein
MHPIKKNKYLNKLNRLLFNRKKYIKIFKKVKSIIGKKK